MLCKMSFGAVERVEEGLHGFLVGILRGGKAGFVDAVVDVVVGPLICGFDVIMQVRGEKVDFGELFG